MTPERAFAAVQQRPGAAWLDGGQRTRGWSVLVWDPREVLTDGENWPRAARGWTRARARDPSVPFSGGVVGYVGYGAGRHVAPVPASAPTPEPEVWLGRYEGALCFRHADASWHPAGSPAFLAEARSLLEEAPPLPPVPPAPPGVIARTVDRVAWEACVERILALIRAGDCYQVNLTRPVWVEGAGDPWAAYRRLRTADAAYGAFLRLSDSTCVLSNSPELLLEVRGRRVASLPIKGTRPRGTTPEEDARHRAELEASDKERAELTMIVDLVRNDLGRVAEFGSVRTGDRALTAHPTVFHTARRVEGTLLRGAGAWEALAAAFPPGSVTGAPKVRACERIAELEPHPRGVYCGAIGCVADGGDATFNVAIRTAVSHGSDARYHVGGGIVIASEPAAEWVETEVKERALRAAFTGR